MISEEDRKQALDQINNDRIVTFNLLSASCCLLYQYVGNNLSRFREEISRQETTYLAPADLTRLPNAADQANFNRDFNMSENFALFKCRLTPILLTCKTTTNSCNLSACYIDGTPLQKDLGVKEKVEGIVQRLVAKSATHAAESLYCCVTNKESGGHFQCNPPFVFLGQ